MAISSRSTKAEILQAYETLRTQSEQGATWQQVQTRLWSTWQVIAREVPLIVKDCYNAGRLARRWVSFTIDELSKPVLR